MRKTLADDITAKVKAMMKERGIETPMSVTDDDEVTMLTFAFPKAETDDASLEKYGFLAYDLGKKYDWDTSITEVEEGGYVMFVSPVVRGDGDSEDGKPTFEKNPNPPERVYMTLAYEYYDAIERGEKKQEWRDCTEYWMRKLLSGKVTSVRLQRGYGGHVGQAMPKQMTVAVNGVYVTDFSRTATYPAEDFDKIPDHFTPAFIRIDLGEIIEPSHVVRHV